MNHLLFFNLGTGEIVIICIAILLLFGGKKLPELAKGLGQSVRFFKKELKDVEDVKNDLKKEVEQLDSTD